MNEKDWQKQITDLLTLYAWLWYHTYDSRRSKEGFPDLVAVKRKRVLFIELKTEKGRIHWAQTEWLKALQGTGIVEAYLWRPSDWDTALKVISAAA